MPYFSVTVLTSVSILVKADTDAQAVSTAFKQADFRRVRHKETMPANELQSESEIEVARQRADQVIEG